MRREDRKARELGFRSAKHMTKNLKTDLLEIRVESARIDLSQKRHADERIRELAARLRGDRPPVDHSVDR